MRLANGTRILVGDGWAVTTLPNGREVHAHPNADSPRMARELGYGDDVAAMTREHDPLHAWLTDQLGMPHSVSLMGAAGCEVDAELATLEEEAVLAVQRFARAARNRGLR